METRGAGTALLSADARIQQLEGLAFVPSGRTFIGSPLDVGSSVDLLVDRYETRHSQWNDWMGQDYPLPTAFRPGSVPGDPRSRPEAWTTEVPAVGMTLEEARAFSERRGMRLLQFEEWLWCAVGPTCRRVPAGRRQRGFANTLDAGLGRATPVGAFESGRTPEAIYDMLGNVWEWIEPPPRRLRTWDVWNNSVWSNEAAAQAPGWVLGGSFLTPEGPIFNRDQQLLALAVTSGHRSNEVGLRCCVDADVYLAALPGDLALGSLDRRRLKAVGTRWGSRANGVLDEVLEQSPGHPWLVALQRGTRQQSPAPKGPEGQ